jgi:hypothetical protein
MSLVTILIILTAIVTQNYVFFLIKKGRPCYNILTKNYNRVYMVKSLVVQNGAGDRKPAFVHVENSYILLAPVLPEGNQDRCLKSKDK